MCMVLKNRATRLAHGKIQLNVDSDNLIFEKYTVANAMALSVKLGIWESALDKFVDSIDHITQVRSRIIILCISVFMVNGDYLVHALRVQDKLYVV